jgi:lysyl-tRNA synthetase class II
MQVLLKLNQILKYIEVANQWRSRQQRYNIAEAWLIIFCHSQNSELACPFINPSAIINAMATLKELRDERLRKLTELRQLGVNPYPAKSERTHDTQSVHKDFVELENQLVTVVGRITSIRKFGKIAFIVIKDDIDQLQLVWRYDDTAKANRADSELLLSDIALLDAGDFIEATGTVIKTQSGEESVQIARLRLLTKSLRPMPTKQDGFTNKEERLRRRYIDMNVNDDVDKGSSVAVSFGRPRVII